MTRVTWVMRPAAAIDTPQVKGGHLAVIRLKCGHVITWKLSRLKSYKPWRFRCVECHELLEEFLCADSCGAMVAKLQGIKNDKQVCERGSGDSHAGRSSNLHGRGAEFIQRRFERCD